MKLLFGILVGLVGITFVLAAAFLPDNSVTLGETLKITDSISTTVIHNALP